MEVFFCTIAYLLFLKDSLFVWTQVYQYIFCAWLVLILGLKVFIKIIKTLQR
jgi:hypothetical protein